MAEAKAKAQHFYLIREREVEGIDPTATLNTAIPHVVPGPSTWPEIPKTVMNWSAKSVLEVMEAFIRSVMT